MTAVELQRTIPVPASAVYRAWLDPQLLVRWAAPVEYDAVRVEVDERVGGHYRCWQADDQGQDVGGFDCEILELVPDTRIVLGWQFVGPDRAPLADGASRLTIALRAVAPDACELTLVHDRLDALERAVPGMTDAARAGWTGTLARLKDAVRAGRPAPSSARDFSAGCAWIDGEFLPIGEARIPILDSGFTRSDVTYDVAGVWDGRFFRLDDHLDRFLRGCAKLRLDVPLSKDELREIMVGTVSRSGLRDAYVEIIVTRGVPGPGERDPRRWTPRVYAYAIPYVWIVAGAQQERGVDVVIARQTHRISDGSVDQTVKNFMWGDLVRGLFEAYDRDATQVVLLGADGLVTEGPGYNVVAVRDGVVRTPAKGVLAGVTRRTALEIAEANGHRTEITDLTADDLVSADEIFFTSTAGGIMPVATLDGRPVGSGVPGPITTRIRARYWELHRDDELCEAVDYRR